MNDPRPRAPEEQHGELPDYMEPVEKKVFDPTAAAKLPGELIKLAKLKAQHDQQKEEASQAFKELFAQQQLCSKLMDESGTLNTTMEIGGVSMQFIRSRLSSVTAEDKVALIADLDARGLGDVAPRTVNAQTLAKLVRDMADEKLPQLKGVKVSEVPSVKIVRK